ncbi:MAG: cysteinyl-tRNA synthetase, partial [Kiritimatiellia bacterium]
YAQRYIDSFHEDVLALGLALPDVEPRVSTSIPAIQDMIGSLVERGHAYATNGNVWFSVTSNANYGHLSGQKPDELRSADPQDGKRHPADFALWKANKPGELSWDSPWGAGRPGWHIECSAMACEHLGQTIDIHGGGLDLVFPHHENEVAQSECAHGKKYVRYWMHNGLLNSSTGEKMGKSMGNVFNIRAALTQFPAESIRLYYLQNHYRSPLPWGDDALPDALAMLARLYEARELAEAMGGEEDPDLVAHGLGADAIKVLELGRTFTERLYSAMDDDFNTARALGMVFELARSINRMSASKNARKRGAPVVAPALAGFALLSEAVGLMGMPVEDFQEEVKDKRLAAMGVERSAVEALLTQRTEARLSKDWAQADALRGQLDGLGIVVMDRPDGAQWRVRL